MMLKSLSVLSSVLSLHSFGRRSQRSNPRWPACLALLALCAAARPVYAQTVIANIPTGANPYGMAVNPVTNQLYVPNYGGSTVTVIDGTDNTSKPVTVGSNPWVLAVNPATNKIYVANYSDGTVMVIDGASNTVTATIPVGCHPWAMVVNSVTNRVYVANKGDCSHSSGSVTVIDGSSNDPAKSVIETVQVGNVPIALAVNPVTNRIYVANALDNAVAVIDGASNDPTNSIIKTVSVGSTPTALAVNPVMNRIYVTNAVDNTVTVIDGAANTVTSSIDAGVNPWAVAVNSVTNQVYVANVGDNTVMVIDGASNTILKTVPVGGEPKALAINQITNQVYVPNYDDGTVAVIDGVTHSATATVPVNGANPLAVTVNPVTNLIYVANTNGNNVAVIEGVSPASAQLVPVPMDITLALDGSTSNSDSVYQTTTGTPTFSATVNSSYTSSPTYSAVSGAANPKPTSLYYQVDGQNGAWTQVSPEASSSNPATFNIPSPAASFSLGKHTLYAFAAYGNEGGSFSTGSVNGNSPEIGNIASLKFQVVGPTTTTLTASANPVPFGTGVAFTATVDQPAATGGVTFTDTINGTITTLGTATLNSGSAALAAHLSGGSHTITASYSGDDDYAASAGTLTETVDSQAPTLSWQAPHAIAYGTPLSASQLNATATAPGTFTYNPPSGTVLNTGTHTLTATFTPTNTADYSTATATTSITVTPAALSITANNATRAYGAANAAFSGSVTGTVSNDAFTQSFSTAATQSSNAGTYAIIPSVSGAALNNYTVSATNGTLTVTRAATVTTLGDSASSITPGQSLTLTAHVQSSTTGAPTGSVNFYDAGTLLGTVTLTDGIASYTTSTLAAGTTHSLIATYGGDPNFTTSSSSTAISIPVASLDFTLNVAANTQSQTVLPGAPAKFTFQVSPSYGSYPSQVSFIATGLPSGAAATFSPVSIEAHGGAQTVTLTIQTAAPTTTAKKSNPFEREAPLALAFLLLPLAGVRRFRRHIMPAIFVVATLAGLASLSGCGFQPDQVKNYNITVTAVSGQVRHSFDLDLNVW